MMQGVGTKQETTAEYIWAKPDGTVERIPLGIIASTSLSKKELRAIRSQVFRDHPDFARYQKETGRAIRRQAVREAKGVRKWQMAMKSLLRV